MGQEYTEILSTIECLKKYSFLYSVVHKIENSAGMDDQDSDSVLDLKKSSSESQTRNRDSKIGTWENCASR